MSFSPTPNFPLTLPPTALTLRAPNPSRNEGQKPLPSLRLVITCQILIPTPLITERVNGRKVEECVAFMVPIGGGVGVSVNVEDGGLGLLEEDEGDVETFVRRRVRDHLRWNKKILGMTSISTRNKDVKSAESHADDPEVIPRDFTLHTITATPSHSPLASHLIPPGVPVAVLQHIGLQISWYIPQPIPHFARKRSDLGDGRGADREVGVVEEDEGDEAMMVEIQDEDDDALLLESDAEDSQEVIVEDEDFLLDDVDPDEQDTSPELNVIRKDDALPHWASSQLHDALSKLIKQHLIKRFPLIFDACLIRYIPSITLPSSLSSSIAHYLFTSATHHTDLASNARQVLKSIWEEQEDYLKHKLQQVEELPARKGKGKGRKKMRLDRDGSSQGSNGSGDRNGNGQRRSRKIVVEEQEEDKMGLYVAELRESLERDDSVEIGRRHLRRIKRILGEAVERIGRSNWDDSRRGKGKLAFWRIPVIDKAPESEDVVAEEERDEERRRFTAGLVPGGDPQPSPVAGLSAEPQWRELPDFDDDNLLWDTEAPSPGLEDLSDDEDLLWAEDDLAGAHDAYELQQLQDIFSDTEDLLLDDKEMLDEESVITPPDQYPSHVSEHRLWMNDGVEDTPELSHHGGMDLGDDVEMLFEIGDDVPVEASMFSYKSSPISDAPARTMVKSSYDMLERQTLRYDRDQDSRCSLGATSELSMLEELAMEVEDTESMLDGGTGGEITMKEDQSEILGVQDGGPRIDDDDGDDDLWLFDGV